jgi:hypothetical protein
VASAFTVVLAGPAGATNVADELAFRTAFANTAESQIDLTANITLTCGVNPNDAAVRTDGATLVVDGHGFTITQTCAGSGVLENIGANAGALTLTNVTITGGTKTVSSDTVINGGGVYSAVGLTLDHVTVTGNTVSGLGGNGGGAAGGPINVIDSTISNNTAEKNGGGFDTNAGEPTVVTRSAISGNTATTQIGGGFTAATQSTTEITDSVISGNHALASRAGGANLGLGPNTVTGTSITGNDAGTHGGGIDTGDETTITDSTIAGNTAVDSGGGVNSGNGGASLDVTRSTVSGNTASNGGGINIGGGGSTLVVTNSTVSGNTGTSTAGGINAGGGDSTFQLTYATVVGNTSPDGANIFFGGPVTAAAFGTVVAQPLGGGTSCNDDQIVSSGYNFEAGSDTCTFTDPTDVVNGADPQLGPLAANGGPTLTLLPASTSPLLDRIPVSACVGIPDQGITTDQRGIARPQQGGCDIGAVEVIPAIALNPTFTG